MIVARNLESLLQQITKNVSTTSKQIIATAVTLPNGSILASSTSTGFDSKLIKLLSLFVYQLVQGERSDSNGSSSTEYLSKFEKPDDGVEVYAADIPNTELKVVVVTEKGYPDGIIRLKMEELLRQLSELEGFEYIEE